MSSTDKRILVACNHLFSVGGTELFTYYLIKALKDQYCMEYFTHHPGEVSDKIASDFGVGFKSRHHYDLIIASHTTTVNYLYGQGPIVQVCHGPIPELEQPSLVADRHIAVSEEVQKHLEQKGFEAEVVLNGVDLEVFYPKNPIGETPKTILSLCQSTEANEWLDEICQDLNIAFVAINKHENPVFDLADEINKADMVIGIGRSAYDAMACGRPCILFDNRVYNGPYGEGYLHPSTFQEFVRFNCSGRYSKKTFSKEGLKNEILHYSAEDGIQLRKIAEESLDLYTNASKILKVGFGISKWQHRLHKISLILKWKKVAPVFKEKKQLFRAKMADQFTNGRPLGEIFTMINKERFPVHVKLSIYFFWLKLFFKRTWPS